MLVLFLPASIHSPYFALTDNSLVVKPMHMYVPKINTRTTNVELTNERRLLIIEKLAPLGKLLTVEEQAHIDVVLRREKRLLLGDTYYLSVKLTTSGGTLFAVAIETQLEKALDKAQGNIKRALSKGKLRQSYKYRKDRRIGIGDRYQLLFGSH